MRGISVHSEAALITGACVMAVVIIGIVPARNSRSAGTEDIVKRGPSSPTSALLQSPKPEMEDSDTHVIRGAAFVPAQQSSSRSVLPVSEDRKQAAPVLKTGFASPQKPAAPNKKQVELKGSDGNEVKSALSSLIRKVQLEEVGISIGPNDGECFTDQMLQTFVSTSRHKKVGETIAQRNEFVDIISELKPFPKDRRMSLLRSARTIRRKTWSEGVPPPEGQTLAGVRAELLIANEIIDRIEETLGKATRESQQ